MDHMNELFGALRVWLHAPEPVPPFHMDLGDERMDAPAFERDLDTPQMR